MLAFLISWYCSRPRYTDQPPTPKPKGNNLQNPAIIHAWRNLTVAEQLARFVDDTPNDHVNVLAEPTLDRWGPAWLATDAMH